MGRRLVTLAARVALLVVALALAVDVAYFVHGSLEMHPTEERQAAVRFATGLAAFFLTLIGLALLLLLRALRRERDLSPRGRYGTRA